MSSISKAIEFDLKQIPKRNSYLDNPELIYNINAKTHGYCEICDIYSATFFGLCRDCFVEQNTSDWKINQEITLDLIKQKRIKLINAEELKKRRKKGLAVINLRR